MADPINRPGGYRKFNTNEVVTSDALNDIGKMALQGAMDALAAQLFRWESDPLGAGAHGGVFGAGDLAPSAFGTLVSQVDTGFGFVFDSADADDFGPVYRPLVHPVTTQLNHAAHEASPRIDLLVAYAGYVDDLEGSEKIYDVLEGDDTAVSVQIRSSLRATVSVVKGVASATPAPPALPAGALKLAEVSVPATAGAITVEDHRSILQIAESMGYGYHRGLDLDRLHLPHVPSSDTTSALLVSQTSPTSLAVLVQPGQALANGRWHHIKTAGTVALAAADPTNPRIDRIYLDTDGDLSVLTGTPAATPVPPTLAAGATPLAKVAVAALATLITNAMITDTRSPQPYSGSSLRDGTTPGAAQTVVYAVPVATPGTMTTVATDTFIDTLVQLKDQDGNNLQEARGLLIEIFDSQGESWEAADTIEVYPNSGGPGSTYKGLGGNSANRTAMVTSAAGQASFEVANIGGTTNPRYSYYKVTVVDSPGGSALGFMQFT